MIKIIFTMILWLITANTLLADDDINFDFRRTMRHHGEEYEGFVAGVGVLLPFSFSHSNARVGVESGNYLDIAGRLKTTFHYRQGDHDWSSYAFVSEAYSMSPTIKNRFIKTTDILRLETRYLYEIFPSLSLYAYARGETSMFRGIDIDAKDNDYEFRDINDKVTRTTRSREIHLDDPFMPLYLQEGVGLAWAAYEQPYLSIENKAGLSLRQTFADQQRILVDEVDDVKIVRDLFSFYQVGPLIATSIFGELFENEFIEYHVGIDVVYPLGQSPRARTRSFMNSLLVDASASINFRIWTYCSISYEYTALRIPDILAQFQQQHSAQFNLNFEWLHKFKK